jgi:hypothetical protein
MQRESALLYFDSAFNRGADPLQFKQIGFLKDAMSVRQLRHFSRPLLRAPALDHRVPKGLNNRLETGKPSISLPALRPKARAICCAKSSFGKVVQRHHS